MLSSNKCWYLQFDLGPGKAVWQGPILTQQTKNDPQLVAVNKKVNLGQVNLGQVRLGQVRIGQVRPVQARLGWVGLGLVR